MIILHILINVKLTNSNSGSVVFYNRRVKSDCWSDDDIVKLRARRSFEELIPHLNPDQVDAKHIKNFLRYFRSALNSIDKDTDPRLYKLLQEAIADTIGAHLRSEILPAVRFAFYAGYVPYRNARQIHDLLDDLKIYLNTQGLGWNKPKKTSQKWANLTVAKVLIGAGSLFDPCSCLITKRDSNSCIHLPVPKHDDVRDPSVVALPFKSGGLVSLVSPDSNNVLLKYYTTASRCILSSSPEKCRHSDFVSFNNELWHWMKRDVAPHLIDEKLYSAYGGILRIAAAVQNYGKGLSRKNLFYYQDSDVTSWNPWKKFTDSYVYINADWTPTVYVIVVLLTAFSIYLVQICYNYICGDPGGCKCKNAYRTSISSVDEDDKPSAVTSTGSNRSPTLLPLQQRSEVFCSDRKCGHHSSNTKSASLGTLRTEKVYDLNENTTKMMEVIMSDSDESLVAELSTCSSEDDDCIQIRRKRFDSPPKLQASISELTVSRARVGSQPPLYCTSTTTRTLTGSSREPRATDSGWSDSESSSSSRSGSSTSSKSRRSRSSRDLAWAKRVISKHSLRNATTSSRIDLDLTSCRTPTSQT